MRRKRVFGKKAVKREIQAIVSLSIIMVVLAAVLGVSLYSSDTTRNFDTRNQASGSRYKVGKNSNLQEVINKSQDQDIIEIDTGLYNDKSNEPLTIENRDITIVGSGKEFSAISGKSSGNAIFIKNSNVKLKDIEISGAEKSGILVDESSTLELENVFIRLNKGSAVSSKGNLKINNVKIDENGQGVLTNSEFDIKNSVISNNDGPGVRVLQSSGAVGDISNTIINDNEGEGVFVEGGDTSVDKVTVVGNGKGIVQKDGASISVTNTVVQGSQGIGVSVQDNAKVSYTNSYGNEGENFIPESLFNEDGNLSEASDFISENEYYLGEESALKDRGNPEESDDDGSRVDIGAYAGAPNITVANSKPVITSSPPSEVVRPGQNYRYEIQASDPDRDELKYTIVNTDIPRWITQDENVFSGTPGASDLGFYGIMVVVSDGNGHNIVHPISINVLPEDSGFYVTPTPTVAPSPTDQPQTTPTPTPEPEPEFEPVITFISPGQGETLTPGDNDIEWEVQEEVDIESIVLRYSSDGQDFKEITTLSGDRTSYTWEGISELPNGEYFIEIEAFSADDPELSVKKRSEQFNIDVSEPDSIQINSVSPVPDDNISNNKPNIQVTFTPAVEIDEESTKLTVNGEEVEYIVGEKTLNYTPETPLNGQIVVDARVVSTGGAEGSRTWSFNIITEATPQPTPSEEETTEEKVLGLPRNIGLLVLCFIVFLLLGIILYLILKLIRTLRDEREGNLEAEFTEYYQPEARKEKVEVKSKSKGDTTVVKNKTTTKNEVPKEYLKANVDDGKSHTHTEIKSKNESNNVGRVSTAAATTVPLTQKDKSKVEYKEKSKTQDGKYNSKSKTTVEQTGVSKNSSQVNVQSQKDGSKQRSTYTQTPPPSVQSNNKGKQMQNSQYTQPSSASSAKLTEDEQYVEELKRKYNISDEEIEDYKKRQKSPEKDNV